MYLTRLLGKSMRWAVVYVEMRIHSEKKNALGDALMPSWAQKYPLEGRRASPAYWW